MADDLITVKIEGLEELKKAMAQFPKQAGKYLGAAGREASVKVVLPTEGLKKYPPAGAANAPPTPYYIRGRGTQLKSRNLGNSEKLGTQWYTQNINSGYSTEIGNRASYAHWVHGDDQASFMAPKGWKKLTEVAKDKMDEIEKVYNLWVDKLLRDVGLK